MAQGKRRSGRECALKILYSLYDQEKPLELVLADFWTNFRFQDDVLGEAEEGTSGNVSADVRTFADELVRGVYDHLEEIDSALLATSKNWSLDRMDRLDLSLMRLASYELLYVPQTPARVVINEAIEIAKRYGTKDSPAFLNGVLDKIAIRAQKKD
ncbi:MAG: transcription antitermination factor NusB [Desulfuromonadaceae bacterium]|nr:transcription antitermination factor NusB [Desulfuromonadaceae bacterium]